MPETSTFHARLRAALLFSGLTETNSQTAIGKHLSLNKQTVDRWMRGGEPKASMLFYIADRMKVDPRWLATGEGSMTPQITLTNDEIDLLQQIYRQLQGKARTKWVRDGHELVEISAPSGPANPFAKVSR